MLRWREVVLVISKPFTSIQVKTIPAWKMFDAFWKCLCILVPKSPNTCKEMTTNLCFQKIKSFVAILESYPNLVIYQILYVGLMLICCKQKNIENKGYSSWPICRENSLVHFFRNNESILLMFLCDEQNLSSAIPERFDQFKPTVF